MIKTYLFCLFLLFAAPCFAHQAQQCSVFTPALDEHAQKFDELEGKWLRMKSESLPNTDQIDELLAQASQFYERAVEALLEDEENPLHHLLSLERSLEVLESHLHKSREDQTSAPFAPDDTQIWQWLREEPKLLSKRINPDVVYHVPLRDGQVLKVSFTKRLIKEVFVPPGRQTFAKQAMEIITRGFGAEEPTLWRRRSIHESFVELRSTSSERMAGCFENGVLVFKAFFKRPEKQAYHLFNQLAKLCR